MHIQYQIKLFMACKKSLKPKFIYVSCMAFLILYSCASTGLFSRLDNTVERNQYSASVALLEKNKSSLYSNRDAVLYYLDKGMLSHYAELYADSSQLLESGERAIEAAFTKSITQGMLSYLVNDNVLDYPGEDYEDIYVNVFGALNYYHRGMIEDAMVEIRRMNNKLANLSTRYAVFVSELQKKALDEKLENIPPNPNAPSKFSDSALARYLGMLFYRSLGMEDDARIDSEGLRVAFANAPAVYTYPPPSSLSGELKIPRGMARLNVIAFSGLSPVKQSQDIRIPIPGMRWAKIALPYIKSRGSQITRIELVFDHGERINLELLEDIAAVARETFKARQNVVYLKSVIRAMLKAIASSALNIAAYETRNKDQEDSTLLSVFSILTQIYAEASEQADLRISRYFPARAHVAGINLEPGIYSFNVNYYGRSGKPIAVERKNNIVVTENALNLAEAFCPK